MVTARRSTISAAGLLGLLALAAPAPVSDAPDNWQRLREMPPELRSQLAAQLKEFDLLPRDEQEAIRALDRKIAAEPDEDRRIDQGVLQRYHAWVQGLTETQRNELGLAPPSKRLALVTKILADRKGAKPASSLARPADLERSSPFDQAEAIKVWLALGDEEKAEVLKLDAAERPRRLARLAREKKVHLAMERPAGAKLDETYRHAVASGRAAPSKKGEDRKKAAVKEQRIADNYWFIENPPEAIGPDQLDKLLEFERALPPWVRGGFDLLPPDEARRRLTILYRLVFGKGGMATTAAKPAAETKAAAKPEPATKPLPARPKTQSSRTY